MFTGLVTAVAPVVHTEARGAGARLTVACPSEYGDIAAGESISVSGACLTALDVPDGGALSFDVSPETLRRTTLGSLRPGDTVNLERSLAVGDRLGGHFVTGHVDATTALLLVTRSGDFWTFSFALGDGWAYQVVEKGSICVDGVSLTVASLARDRFDVAIIPHTLEHTTLGRRRPGELVNVETDLLAKHVIRLLDRGEDGRRDDRLADLLAG